MSTLDIVIENEEAFGCHPKGNMRRMDTKIQIIKFDFTFTLFNLNNEVKKRKFLGDREDIIRHMDSGDSIFYQRTVYSRDV